MPPRRIIAPPENPILHLGAAELARRIARRELSSVEVFDAYRARIDEVNPQVNAIVVPRYDEARLEAEAADRAVAEGQPLGPLHGVPLTVKDCFHVPGLPSTIGLTNRIGLLDNDSSPLVARLRAAGAVLMGKTNVPQLMVWHECDNPVYGCTNSPYDLGRTPGGSTGGEAAAIASHCSPLGLGNDLGGSIRVPASWNGLYGFKPTSYRLTNVGTTGAFRGLLVMVTQAGPLARTAEDCELMFQVLVSDLSGIDTAPVPPRDPQAVDLPGMRIAAWEDDGYFPASAPARRAVREAAQALEQLGATIVWIKPPRIVEMIELYYSIVGSDGGVDASRMLRGSKVDHRVARMLWMAGLSQPVRWSIVQTLRLAGQIWQASLVSVARPRSAAEFWQLCEQLGDAIRTFNQEVFVDNGIQAILSPPHALPAPHHEAAIDLLPAASYAFHANLLGLPAGVTPWTTVHADETVAAATSRDVALRRVEETLMNAEGQPVGVQIAAQRWRDDVVLAVMQALETSRARAASASSGG
jgi:fatty acid amide hydrolase